MKTIRTFIFLPVFLLGAYFMQAQEKKSRVCIKVDKNENGTVSKIDTCFESTDPVEIDAFLKRMGMDADVSVQVKPEEGSKKTVIVKNIENTNGSESAQSYSFSMSGNDTSNVMVFVDENGKVTTCGATGAKVIVHDFNGDEDQMNNEIQTIIKEAEENSDGTHTKKIMVFVSRKIEISDVSKEDRKSLPKTLKENKGESFHGLSVFPNPSKGSFNLSFKGNTNETLEIKIMDTAGKTVMNMQEKGTETEFNKRIDISGLAKGIYFLHVTQGKKSEIKKIVITE